VASASGGVKVSSATTLQAVSATGPSRIDFAEAIERRYVVTMATVFGPPAGAPFRSLTICGSALLGLRCRGRGVWKTT